MKPATLLSALVQGVIVFFLSVSLLGFIAALFNATDPGPGMPHTPAQNRLGIGIIVASVIFGLMHARGVVRQAASPEE